MNLSEPFIRRPVMTSMVMLAIVLFGLIAFFNLPISDLPSIEYPTITITARNPGSDAQTMANNVATPLEQQLMAIEGVNVIVSQSSYGITKIVANFDLYRTIDGASTDVMQAINAASGNLPPEMPSSPSYVKTNPSDAPVIYIAVSSETMTLGELYDYANTAIGQRFSMVEGVSEVQVYGSKTAVRVKLNPDKLAAMNLGINEVSEAVINANQSLPSGTVYNQNRSYTLDPLGQVTSGEAYDKVIVAERGGTPIFLSDIGKGVDSTEDEYYFLDYWTKEYGIRPTVVVAVTKQSGFNTVKICDTIREMLPTLRQEIPAAIHLSVIYDRSVMIKASIWDVEFTLLLAFGLVVLVIFLFLGNLSTTIIPSLALPIAIIGTFALMYANNYTIDILSMLGLTLVVGFLVDDAIVVLENIVRHMEMNKTPFQAALEGSKQISTTVLSMTLSLTSVFIPFIFMPGLVGRMFHEFSMVVIIAVLFSGFLSLTLTPMLCSRFLRPGSKENVLEKFAKKVVSTLLAIYEPMLIWVLRHRWIPCTLVASTLVATLYLFTALPQDFLPPGDTGAIQGIAYADQGASLFSMEKNMKEFVAVGQKNPYVQSIVALANIPDFAPSNQGIIFFNLIEASKRPIIEKVTQQLNEAFRDLVGMKVFIHPMPEINLNVGVTIDQADYRYTLSTIEKPDQLYGLVEEMTQKLQQLPDLEDVSSNIQIDSPQLSIEILRDQASQFGISVKDIEKAFSLGYGGGRVSTYNTPLNIYNIVVQMEDAYRKNPAALDKIRLTSNHEETKGQLVPLESVAKWKEDVGPIAVNHNNQFTAASILFNVAEGSALSTALKKINQLADEMLPPGILRSFQGQAEIFQKTMKEMIPLLIIGILVIYLLLGSLYESFIHPITILSTLPGALFGGLLMLFLFQATLSLYSYVGMIVLIGIVLKNGIMLVEFANENVEKGDTAYHAIVDACKVRFRPILMTTVAAAMGAVPIALGFGADASSRRPLGLVILGGLLFAQLITYFFTPVVYLYLEAFQDRYLRRKPTP